MDGIEIEEPRLSTLGARHGRSKETLEQRMRSIGPRLELGMGLGPDEVGMIAPLNELDQPAVWRGPGAQQPGLFQLSLETTVVLVAMAVPLRGDFRPIELGDHAAWSEHCGIGAQPHGATHVRDVDLLGHEIDDGALGELVELGRVGTDEAGEVPCGLDHHHLHTEADAQQRNVVLTSDLGCGDHALDAALTEAAGDDDPIEALETIEPDLSGDHLGIDPGSRCLRRTRRD